MEAPRAVSTRLYVYLSVSGSSPCFYHLLSIPCPPHVTMRPEETPVLNSPFPPLQYGSGIGDVPSTTHDTSRVSYHVKHLDTFAQTLQEVRDPSSCTAPIHVG